MELDGLDRTERLALVALIKTTLLADRTMTEGEQQALRATVARIGEEAYRNAMDEADRRFGTRADLESFLVGVSRQEARDLIYGTVLDLALADGLALPESSLLMWLTDLWNVEVRPHPGTV